MSTFPKFDLYQIESISKILGEEVTGSQLSDIFNNCNIDEIEGSSSTKWVRIKSSLLAKQKKDNCGNNIANFIKHVANPARYYNKIEQHKNLLLKLNQILPYNGLKLDENFNFYTVESAKNPFDLEKQNISCQFTSNNQSKGEKRYQVFVSSTFDDLQAERRLVFDALIHKKCFPVGMEYFPSLTITSLPYIYKLIEESDFFIVFTGGRYGKSRDENEKSFTHLEVIHAKKKGIPVIVLIHDDWGTLINKETEPDDKYKLDCFIRELKNLFDGWKTWNNTTLMTGVINAIEQAIIDNPQAAGWVRANS